MGGGGKISMPPMVGVRIFSGTTHYIFNPAEGTLQTLLQKFKTNGSYLIEKIELKNKII